VFFSDVTFFVRHADQRGGHIQPYVMRCWYDTINQRWRPMGLSYFADRNDKIDIDTIPTF
jgi:hypothetical protein